ncbi:hypothetical protein [Sphingorhabdus sp. SMR4y]|uniref:hypothetical protein n=1 Tax=Sphingorhabdus sp. SMR4y TaxID=2584094 RepID=UPI000B5CD049|nr:hypothetical protein [Sphingorhabdus sp. SMR4y]ASK89098.1 hypothetical protein SPHFLASMR4Y_02355 [Sphingorhabdus sp. SMR4y]
MTLYLLYCPQSPEAPLDLHGDGYKIDDNLYVIRSELTRSQLYHRIKWQLENGSPLLLAPLSDAPKFKGMNPGALKWLREYGY